MKDPNKNSRIDKFDKRRKNTKSISLFLILGGILIIFLLGLFLFGGNEETDSGQPSTESTSEKNAGESNDEATKDETNNDEKTSDENSESTKDDSTNSGDSSDDPNAEDEQSKKNDDTKTEESEDNNELEKETVEVPDEPNVKEAYTANWKPIGTEQEGPHTTQFDTETQDWKEMEKAIRLATGLQEGNMITEMIENGGDQKVIGTVTDQSQENVYQVNLTWVENEGWKPTMVKILKENPYD
ncbi:YrrS family protein [Virgibacillus necropolis]|uniref:DUF1510 domain-containing protein n=1 Tax=Virgibacillus necropolis TaxID=163877 RepID=A0A221MBY5_9BACI|nr:YrrS family protein [Virgibacillus necropolis]ASN05151.1 hypothetical protein CFK40_09055 [Virgibacillus necropolis]